MATINVARVLNSPKFVKSFNVYRETGAFVAGRWTQTSQEIIAMRGVIVPEGTKDIIQVLEGDRTSQLASFYCKQEIFVTRNDGAFSGTSDRIEWRGSQFRIFKVLPWSDFGYYKAFGVSVEGD